MIKKYLSGFILLSLLLLNLPVFAEIIEDEVAKEAFAGKTFTKPEYKKEIITDNDEIALKNKNLSKPQFKNVTFEDDSSKNDPHLQNCIKPAVHYKLIDENAEIVKIPIHSAKLIKPKDDIKIGQTLIFTVSKDVFKDGKIFIKQNTPVNAYVELISKAARFGDPDEIELGRFSAKDINGNTIDLDGTIRKQGADRGKWAKPLYYAGATVPFGAPLMLFYFVKGGKVKITQGETFELYYE